MRLTKKISTGIVLIALLFFGARLISCRSKAREMESIQVNRDSAQLVIGQYLFFDRRLSINNTRSCGTCHNPAFAFTDGYKRSLGAFADLHQRNTEPLFNLSYLKYLTAADSTLHTPLQQMKNPLLNEHPSEMGVKGNEEVIFRKIKNDPLYKDLFQQCGQELSWDYIKKDISLFTLSLVSDNSPYDRYKKGDSAAIPPAVKKGIQLFFSSTLACANCHGGFNFSSPNIKDKKGDTIFYFNTGLYNTNGKGAYPAYDRGLMMSTHNKNDMGKYRVPSLRNLAFTAPYFHDGSAATLKEVIDIYTAGGRNILQGTDKGNGIQNPYKHALIKGFSISETDKINLISFLLSLSDSSFVQKAKYQNPFNFDETEKKY